MSPAIETILIGGYAVALLVGALTVDATARRAHRRAYRRAGRFHRRIALAMVWLSALALVLAAVRQPANYVALLPFSLAWAGVAWALTEHLRHPGPITRPARDARNG
ncbi:hypothetical protein [Nocardia seriolae]|uniref:DUF3325 domain-containing protein n=1 Tax=Nocardia seriolae TaxID=37332 RepID=A0A0B8NH40_9NOCA|nr:hypothetical protein [Nocardia seriolae]APA97931.1 hypothetical protein NS506_03882 [Nocardia seriolae]MTJ64329.1 hypothetical protein [Nocardia seriolae]MTJ74084.1 hypothetical protein [Nocardia seriolae]MTJ87676.1 hypothetical protein [Nocardia seriolae]MTK31670.1 hypothetical protein [Nocardia seriolae]